MTERRLPEEDEDLAPSEQRRLDAWLDAARNADLTALEERPSSAPERRALHVQRLAKLIQAVPEARTTPRRWRGLWTWAAAAAAGLLLIVGAAKVNHFGPFRVEQSPPVASTPGASLRQVVGSVIARHPNGENSIMSADARVAAGDEISTTAEGFASLEVDKARVDLSNATTLQLETLGAESQIFHLQAGRVDVSVPKVPGKKRRLEVKTVDTLVTVLGTAFSVEFAHLDGEPLTSVNVTRGVVAVDRGGRRVTLHPGESWNSRDGKAGQTQAAAEDAPPVAVPAAPVEAPPIRRAPPPAVVRPETETETEASQLAAQNRLFEQALHARDQGDDRLAARRLRQLLAKYPDAPLRSTVRAELRAATKRLAEAED